MTYVLLTRGRRRPKQPASSKLALLGALASCLILAHWLFSIELRSWRIVRSSENVLASQAAPPQAPQAPQSMPPTLPVLLSMTRSRTERLTNQRGDADTAHLTGAANHLLDVDPEQAKSMLDPTDTAIHDTVDLLTTSDEGPGAKGSASTASPSPPPLPPPPSPTPPPQPPPVESSFPSPPPAESDLATQLSAPAALEFLQQTPHIASGLGGLRDVTPLETGQAMPHASGGSGSGTQRDTSGPPHVAPAPPPPPPEGAVLRKPVVEASSTDSCAEALQLPRVAMLFLTRGDVFHHISWRLWFEAARGMLPARQLHAATCNSTATLSSSSQMRQLGESEQMASGIRDRARARAVAAACGWNVSSGTSAVPLGSAGCSGLIQQQPMFSVYMHAPPDVSDNAIPELFRGYLIKERVHTPWGTHKLVEATRNLLLEAYRDPLNMRFVLFSESDIPLYDPFTFYQQLMAETKSRINVCRDAAPTDDRRWSSRMENSMLKKDHWRKSSQFFGLQREHVQLVLDDVDVYRQFEKHCWDGWDGDCKCHRDCFSDEHYIPTLLAVLGRDNESYCGINGITSVDWSAGGPHPKAYKDWEVHSQLIRYLRGTHAGCAAFEAISDAQRMFVSKESAFAVDDDAWKPHMCSQHTESMVSFQHALRGNCSLTARKFPKSTRHAVIRAFVNCEDGLQLMGAAACAMTGA